MAAVKSNSAGDRFDRTHRVHLDRNSVPSAMAAAARGVANSDSHDPSGKQLRTGPYAEGLRDQPGYLGLSAVRDDFHRNRATEPQTEIDRLKNLLWPDFGETEIHGLLDRFGSIANFHGAEFDELVNMLPNAGQAAKLQSLIQIAAEIGNRSSYEQPAIHNCVELIGYLQATMGSCRVETFRVLFLDTHNRLIADEVLWSGTVSEVQIYPREVIRRALELDCSAFIAAHNHPSNVVTPSKADIAMTIRLLQAAGAMGIALHDHLIVSASGYHSMRFHKSVDPWR